MVQFEGKSKEEAALWFTHLHWCRTSLGIPHNPLVVVDDPANRLTDAESRALQTVVFAAFTLEYRLKSVLLLIVGTITKKDYLRCLLTELWDRLENRTRIDNGEQIVEPPGWGPVLGQLMELAQLRNDIAHCNRKKILAFLHDNDVEPLARARRLYNSVVDGIGLINYAVGHDPRPLPEIQEYLRPVKAEEPDFHAT